MSMKLDAWINECWVVTPFKMSLFILWIVWSLVSIHSLGNSWWLYSFIFSSLFVYLIWPLFLSLFLCLSLSLFLSLSSNRVFSRTNTIKEFYLYRFVVSFIKCNMYELFYSHFCVCVKNTKIFTKSGIFKKETFIHFSAKFTKVILHVIKDITFSIEYMQVKNIWLPSFVYFIEC